MCEKFQCWHIRAVIDDLASWSPRDRFEEVQRLFRHLDLVSFDTFRSQAKKVTEAIHKNWRGPKTRYDFNERFSLEKVKKMNVQVSPTCAKHSLSSVRMHLSLYCNLDSLSGVGHSDYAHAITVVVR